jgi:DNA-binding GntR family transcriptional regulator
MTVAEGSELVRSLRGQIVDQLRNDVLAGRIQQGTFLRQEELVARFRVSRTPVREALIQLTNEGLLEAIPNTGVKVRHQPPDHVQAFLTPLRRTIEVYALQLCFDKLNSDDFRRWDAILGQLRKACAERDYPGMAQNEIEFHRSIVHRSGEPTLMGIWSLILSQVAAQFRDSYVKYDDPLDVYREHVAIVDKFRTGDLEASVKLYTKMIGAPAPKHSQKKSKSTSKGKK